MNVAVMGLWHLGCVTAACLAAAGHAVTGLDFDAPTVIQLQNGHAPLFEPGLDDLLTEGLHTQTLRFTTEPPIALKHADVLWLTYDTPVDADDQADVAWVVAQFERVFPYLSDRLTVLISSQLPVGSTHHLEKQFRRAYPEKTVAFACSPENLRLGKAIEAFVHPERIVIGVDDVSVRARLASLFASFAAPEQIEWMSVASAEMTKHALNAFLAVSVTFINEVAALCEAVGADAQEVERGLKSEARIGPRAYLKPGGAFAGGTLARDVAYLTQLGDAHQRQTHLLSAVRASNEAHKGWALRHLQAALGRLDGQRIAVLGLAYKPGTSTLRRSSAIELCRQLVAQGAHVQAFDPLIAELPAELAPLIVLQPTAEAALTGAMAVVIATECPAFKQLKGDALVKQMTQALVLDPNRFLGAQLGADPRIRYHAVGRAT